MNLNVPSLWTLIGFLITLIGWFFLILKFSAKYGRQEEQLSKLNKDSEDRVGARINDPAWKALEERVGMLEMDAKKLKDLQIAEGKVLTFETHEKMCGSHLVELKKEIIQMLDLKLEAMENSLLLALRTGRKTKKK